MIIGAGASSSTPKLECVLNPSSRCTACLDAHANPSTSRNNRLNPSFMIHLKLSHPTTADGEETDAYVMIDCGKTFRESVLKVFPKLGIPKIDVVLVTHDHADASNGIDDLREFTYRKAVQVFTDPVTESRLRNTVGYLFPKESGQSSMLWTASIEWRRMYDRDRTTGILDIEPLPSHPGARFFVAAMQVEHGVDTHCNAFIVPLVTSIPRCNRDATYSVAQCRFLVYMSDVSVVDDKVLSTITQSIQALHIKLFGAPIVAKEEASEEGVKIGPALGVEVLVLDLLADHSYVSHIGFKEALAAAIRISATRTYFVGMSHTMEYNATNERIQKETDLEKRNGRLPADATMELGWDGCCVFGRIEGE